GTSAHAFKVNFCKFTNETRCAIEDASAHSGQRYVAALNGTASGGGYELAIACAEIYLVDDGNSAVSLPEVPLLGVLPGTGGLKLHRAGRYADLTVRAPEADLPTTPAEIEQRGDSYWPLQAYRELDDALLHLRINELEIGLVCLRTAGEIEHVLAVDRTLAAHRDHWLAREIILNMARALRRLDLTAKSFFALIEPGSCFAGNLLELALSADRTYMLNSPDEKVELATSELNTGALPMSNGLTRLQSRFLAEPEHVDEVLAHEATFDTAAAEAAGLVTS